MKNVQETRTLFGGVDSDSAPFLIKEGMLLNSMNMRAITQKNQNTGSLQPVAGHSTLDAVNNLLTSEGGIYTMIGKCPDEINNQMFLFFFCQPATGTGNLIVRYDITSDSASVFFRDDFVVNGLTWNISLIISPRIYGDILIFTDGTTNGLRSLNITKTYTSISPITQNELSFIPNPFTAPLQANRITDTATTISTVQRRGMQFTYRVINTDGFVSVLAMYSETVPPERESNIALNASSGNGVLVKVSKLQPIPNNWKQVDFIVRNLDDNTFYVIKSFYLSNPADVVDVNNHNTFSNPYALNSGNYFGQNQELLDDVYKAKLEDVVPVSTKTIEIAENRLLCGNNVLGYDPGTANPDIAIVQNVYVATEATLNSTSVYFLYTMNDAAQPFKIYAGLFVQIGAEIFALPREVSQLIFEPEEGTINSKFISNQSSTFPYVPSQVISKDNLIPMITPAQIQPGGLATLSQQADAGNNGRNINTALYPVPKALQVITSLVWELHKLGTNPAGSWKNENTGIALFDMQDLGSDIYVQDDPSEYYSTMRSRAFLPNSKMKYGIKFFDDALRACSVREIGSLSMPDYNPYTRQLVESVTFTPNTLSFTGIPTWARYCALTMAKQNICTNFLMFSPNIIKIARINDDGTKTIDANIFNNITPGDVYGLAVPLASLQQQNAGYAFAQGDSMRLSFGSDTIPYSSSTTFVYPIIDSFDGYAIAGIQTGDLTVLLSLFLSSQYNNIGPVNYDIGAGVAIAQVPTVGGSQRQTICYVTIYQQPQSDFQQYETSIMGIIQGNQIQGFYDPNGALPALTYTLLGDCYTQKRIGNTGTFTGLSMTTNETTQNKVWVDIFGRVAPFTIIGQKTLTNEIRWSNSGSTQTNVNGIASFDAPDYKLNDRTAGDITFLILTSREIQMGGQLVVLSTNGSHTGMVGQQQFYNADNETQVNASSPQVLNVLNPIRGGWGCQSPKSVVAYNGLVFWVDVKNQKVIQFSQAGADQISKYNNTRLWRQLLVRASTQNQSINVLGGLNPFSSEYIVHVPSVVPTPKPSLPSVPTLENPLDFYYDQRYSYAFNWDTNSWNFVWDRADEFITVDQEVFGWDRIGRKAYREFGNFSAYVGGKMIVTIPFGANNYPTVYSPLSLKLDTNRPPDQTWIQCDAQNINGSGTVPQVLQMVAGIDGWSARETDYATAIRKNRLSNNATTPTTWEAAGVNGWSIKGKIVAVVLVWNSEGGFFNISSATLTSRISSGH